MDLLYHIELDPKHIQVTLQMVSWYWNVIPRLKISIVRQTCNIMRILVGNKIFVHSDADEA